MMPFSNMEYQSADLVLLEKLRHELVEKTPCLLTSGEDFIPGEDFILSRNSVLEPCGENCLPLSQSVEALMKEAETFH